MFTLIKLFMKDRIEKYKLNNPQCTKQELNTYQSNLPSLYKKLPTSTKQLWTAKAEDKIRRQPQIRDQIIVALQDNPSKGY